MARACPLCGSGGSVPVVRMRADRIVANSTYRKDALEVLGLSGDRKYPVVRCEACAFVFASDPLPDAMLERLYEDLIVEEEDLRHEASRERIAAYVGIWCSLLEGFPLDLEDTEPLRVLDYGAGHGSQLEVVRAPGVEVCAFETSARRAAYMAEHGIRVLSSPAELVERGPFHFVVCNQVLEHVPDPTAVLARLHDLLHASGRMYLAVPCYSDEVLRASVESYHAGGEYPEDLNPWEHLNYFSPEAFARLLERQGLRVRRWPLIRPAEEDGRVVLGYVPAMNPATHWTGAVVEHAGP